MMKQTLSIAALSLLAAGAMSAQTLITGFTFETSSPATAGPFAAESGTGSALGFHSNSATVYSSPSGDGSAKSFSSNTWSVGDYYQFTLSTTGFSGIYVAFGHTGSNTGPSNFNLQYSLNGGTSFTLAGSYTVTNDSWSTSGGAKQPSIKEFNLSGITALNNQTSVIFQIVDTSTTAINGTTVAVAGSSRVDDFNVSIGGFVEPAVVPEPATYAYLLGGFGVLALMMRRRRRLA